MNRRGALLSIMLSLSFVVSLVSSAHAASTGWDPNDVGGRLDLRWVGVYQQDADTVRIGITLWDPVRAEMLPRPDYRRELYVLSQGFFNAGIYGQGYIFFSADRGRWVMEWIDGGSSGLVARFPVDHPNANMFRVWLPAENATGIGVLSCEHGNSSTLPACGSPASPEPPAIQDWIPGDYLHGLDPI